MDEKVVHMAHQIRGDGAVKALCFRGNRPINMRVASWTNRAEAVTCKKCTRILKNDRDRD